ncbi:MULTISPECIES: type VII secretion protein EssB [Clostridium]|uniref:type VII secretion protein EssB n=1 Tax=Clostridium TaxID=1485 RepID=UPI000983D495|nr:MULTISPECIES: type VII secretion protein EssB [Clostridium]AQR92963.1 putative membrane protein essB [Clostridium saccharoperbutylacetonicum]NSB34374.1 type VII secretion protein EssB [Clostridium saccharoperbutylacetonicum]
MNDNKLEVVLKISDLKAKNSIEINRIAYENRYLVPCELDIQEEEVKFIYDLNGLKLFSEIKNAKLVDKLRVAINISDLFEVLDEYSFDLNPNNLYCDYSFNVKILGRDIKLEEEIINYEEMVLKYKSIIAYIFNDEYSYDDFYNGGLDLIKANKHIKKYALLNSVKEIRDELLVELQEQERNQRENYIEIKLRSLKIRKYSIVGMSIIILGLSVYMIYNSIFLNPYYLNIIKANNYYMTKDYEGVIKSLESTRGLKLDKESKYKLAYSYIISENLSDAQKKNIIANLDAKSDENILDYWIALGKSKYDEAIDLSKKLQDDELTLYALLNKDKYIQDNNKMTGEEKQKEKEAIKSEIDKLTKELNGNNTFQKNSVNDKKTENINGNSTKEEVAKDKNSSESSGLSLVPSSN